MSEQRIIVTRDDLISGRELPPNMINDLLKVASAPFDDIRLLSQQISQEPGILTEARVRELVNDILSDEEMSDGVSNAILSLESQHLEHILSLLERWRRVSPGRVERFPDELFSSLKGNLRELIQEYNGLALLRKANQLLRATGNEFEAVTFLCDLRPVFDVKREHLEGFVTLANMRLAYTRQNGENGIFEMAFTQEELAELQEQISSANQKIDVLKSTFKNVLD
jgi:uncharacterized protein YecE (DUF72 family)